MSYKYTDEEGDFLVITGNDDPTHFTIQGAALAPNEEAPRIALEILKAAGYPPLETGGFHTAGTVGHLQAIAQELTDCIEINDKLTAAESRDERRDELAAEFTSVKRYSGQLPYTQRLIDRIIELESRP